MRLPLEVILGEPVMRPDDPEEYAKTMKEEMPKIWALVKENIEGAQEEQKKHYDKRHREMQYQVGDLVWIYKPARKKGMTDKLVHKNKGPYRVVDRYKEVNYIVETIHGGKRREVHHVGKLTPCYSRDILESTTEVYSMVEESSNTEIYEVESPVVPNGRIGNTQNEGTATGDGFPTPEERDGISIPAPNQSTPRVSTRRTKAIPAVRYSPTLYVMAMVALMTIPVEGVFHKVSPIIWRNTGKPALVGITPVSMAVKYHSPCELLADPTILPTGAQPQLFEWCNTTFNTDFIVPIRKLCKVTQSKEEIEVRQKRLAITAIVGLGAIAIGAATSVGLSATAITKVSSLEERVNNIHNQQMLMMEALKQVTDNDKVEKWH